MKEKQSYLEEAEQYHNGLWQKMMGAQMRRSLVIRAGTLGALGGASAVSALLAACGAGGQAAEEAKRSIQEVEKATTVYTTYNPLADKYHWRRLPWPTTPYLGGELRYAGAYYSSFALLTSSWSSGGRYWETPMHTRYGAGADMNHPEMALALADKSTPAPDYSYVDYHVRPKTYFHDIPPVNGRLCTAEDVKYSLELWRTKSVVSETMTAIERIEVLPDKETVRVYLKRPILWLNHMLGSPNYHVFAKEHYEGDQDVWKQQPIGTGPLKVALNRYRERTENVAHAKYSLTDERWAGYKLPFIRGITELYIADAATSKSAYRSKQIDIIAAGEPVDFNDILATNPDSIIQVLMPVGPYGPHAWFINNKDPLFRDVRVRRALNMAIDKKTMIQTIRGGMAIPSHPISWNLLGREEPFTVEEMGPWQQYNPTKAKELLAEAGYPNGFEMEFLATAPVGDLNELTAQYLKNIGVRVKFDTKEASVVSNVMANRSHRHGIGGFYPSALTGVKTAREFFMPDSALNRSWVDDPEMTALVEKATYTLDADEQLRLLAQINQRAWDQGYAIERFSGFYNEFRHPWVHNRANATSGWASYFGNWQDALVWADDKAPGDRAGKLRA